MPGKGSWDIHCSRSGKGRQRAELSCGHTYVCMGCVCGLLHKAAACRTYLLELATAGSEVWAWPRRGLSCAAGWLSDLQPAEDIGKCGVVALVCLRLCYLGDGFLTAFWTWKVQTDLESSSVSCYKLVLYPELLFDRGVVGQKCFPFKNDCTYNTVCIRLDGGETL